MSRAQKTAANFVFCGLIEGDGRDLCIWHCRAKAPSRFRSVFSGVGNVQCSGTKA